MSDAIIYVVFCGPAGINKRCADALSVVEAL